MFFEAQATYTPAYYATCHYGMRAIAAVAELDRPAVFTATTTDMLYPHMARFPALKPGQEIREIGTSHAVKHALIAEGFARFGSAHAAPADRDALIATTGPGRQFVDGTDGGQIHLRYAGDPTRPALLLLHDAPGSALSLEPLMSDLAEAYFVIAPDLPGHGESDAFEGDAPSLKQFASAAAGVLATAGVERATVHGLGFCASVALRLARDRPDLVTAVVMGGLLAATPEERAGLAERFTPSIAIEADGGHWYRTWLMLRDSLVWWPWYDRRKDSQRKVVEDFGADRLHRWTLEVMRRRTSYGDLVQAALAEDAAALIGDLSTPACLLTGAPTPLAVYDDTLAARFPDLSTVTVGDRRYGTALLEALWRA